MTWNETGLPGSSLAEMPTHRHGRRLSGRMLVEGTNLSRPGTTRTSKCFFFCFWGAPWLGPFDLREEVEPVEGIAAEVRDCAPSCYPATVQKHAAGRAAEYNFTSPITVSARLRLYDRLSVARALAKRFAWRAELTSSSADPIDLLFGSRGNGAPERVGNALGMGPGNLSKGVWRPKRHLLRRREPHLLYR